MKNKEEQYIKGFNNGYILAKYEPHLLQKITKGLDSNNDYVGGLLAGKEEHDIERVNKDFEKYKKHSSEEKTKDRDTDKGLNIKP